MDTSPQSRLLVELTEREALAIGLLIARTWPKPGKDAPFRAKQLLEIGRAYAGPVEQAPRSFLLLDGQNVVAHALAEPRTIITDAGPLTIAALGKVCTDPSQRGKGLGVRVVAEVFRLVDDGIFPFSLFQTSNQVRPFYDRLGCVPVENRFIDSTSTSPMASPFWDEVVMRYPFTAGWPEGTIDLLGPGF